MTGPNTSPTTDPERISDLIGRAISTIEDRQTSAFKVAGKLVSLPGKGRALVVGDLHGDLESLNKILGETDFREGGSSEETFYGIFLGDYVDRGPEQIEVICTVLDLLVEFPDRVLLLRGNHEGPGDIELSPRDFPVRLQRIYGERGLELFLSFQQLFNHLYTAVLVEGKALMLHGGIPTEAEGLSDIAYAHQNHPYKTDLTEILWNDPSDLPGIAFSNRGIGKMFGADVASRFLEKIGVDVLIRGHQPCQRGFSFVNGKVLTLFSCKLPQYGNRNGAYLLMPLNATFDKRTLTSHIRQI